MAKDGEAKKDFKKDLLLVVAESEPNSKYPWKIQVIRWFIDGKPTAPKLEHREYYTDKESGDLRMGKKVSGLKAADWALCQDKAEEIGRLLNGGGSSSPAEPAEQASSEVEEAPF